MSVCSECRANSVCAKGLCRKCYSKQYNNKNIEHKLQCAKQYYLKNRERIRECQNQRYNNKSEVRAYKKIYNLMYRPRNTQLIREYRAVRRGWGKID